MDESRTARNDELRRLWTGQPEPKECSHLDQVRDVEPSAEVCEACVELGDTWPALRICLVCGFVGCCQEAKNQHHFEHFQGTGHPVMGPYNGEMEWIWCYVDEALLDA